jgi:hypothetical protein
MAMNITDSELIKQIKKWTEKLENERACIELTDRRGENPLRNVDAYISDSKHFFNKKDYVRSFECLIYAWGILETSIELGAFRRKD